MGRHESEHKDRAEIQIVLRVAAFPAAPDVGISGQGCNSSQPLVSVLWPPPRSIFARLRADAALLCRVAHAGSDTRFIQLGGSASSTRRTVNVRPNTSL